MQLLSPLDCTYSNVTDYLLFLVCNTFLPTVDQSSFWPLQKLSPVGSNVGSTVGAVVVGILARIYHVRNPEAGPADEKAQQSSEDVSFGRRFIIQSGYDVFLAGRTGY